ncbi:hypothetical protein ACH347_24390 [Saccharopolyspora sp. 5N102]|uniref:hypothetical protein n=1 Tax=Saccharopolyspora sp. 5N102 TaxID=3375155 RepID=UPI0037B29A46
MFRWRGSIGLVGQRGEAADTRESGVLDALPQAPGVAALVVSGAAASDPGLTTALWQACGKLFGGPVPHRMLWLVMPGAGRPDAFGNVCAQVLADSFGVEVIAPTGQLAVIPPGPAFAVGAAGAAGWNRFRRGAPSAPFGYRLPPPSWEAMLPGLPLVEKDLVFEHVPAGLLVRDVRSRPSCPGDPAWDVPVDARRPRVVLGRPGADEISHEQLVAGLRRLPPQLLDVAWFVPLTAGTQVAAWSQGLAESLGRGVVVTPGVPMADGSVVVRELPGGRAWPTMPTLLRYSPGAPAEVLAAAPPPRGWVADGALGYRPAAGQRVGLRVVPAGLVMTGPGDTAGPVGGPFEPHRMTIVVTPSAAVEEVDLLRDLLGWLAQRCGGCVRLLAVGVQEERLRDQLRGIARESGVELDVRGGLVAVESPRAKAKSGEESTVVIPTAAKSRPATLSSGPSASPSSERAEPPTARLDARFTGVRSAPHAPPLVPSGHKSSEGERAAFLAWAADEFNDAVGVVNAALALTPALRGDDETAARVDLVAVRLYLGAGARGGAALNEALREERALPCAEFLACLTSGLRRLPVRRGPVFRQASWSWQQDVRDAYPLGEVLSEPGLLSAVPKGECVAADLAVDFGIWSRTACRASALATPGENEELVFCQRSRFKVLAVDDSADTRPAVLLGELAADEKGGTGELTDHDLAVAEKLREALRLRRAVEPSVMGEVQASRFQSPVGLVAGAVAGQSISATAS